jgi:mannosyltransferase
LIDRGSGPSRANNVGLAAIAVVAAIGLLPWLDKPLFRDEGASLYSAHLGWAALWRQSRVVDLVLLPYYSFLHLWIELSGSIEWVRAPSLLAFGVTVFLAGRLGCRLAGNACGVVAAIVVATNPLMISAALEARPYGLSTLASTAAVISLIRWLDGGGIRWIWWFSLGSVATLLLQMFSILAPLSVLVVVVLLRPHMVRAHWRELIAPISILVALTVSFAVVAAPQAGQIAWIRFDLGLRAVINSLLGPAFGGERQYRDLVCAFALAGAGLCVLAWRRGRFRPTRRELELLAVALGWAALPALVLITMSLVKPVYSNRYVTASVPGLALAVAFLTVRGFQLATIRWPDRSRLAAGGTAVAIGALVVISTSSVPAAAHFSENLQDAAQYLVAHVGDGSAALPDHSVTTGIDYYLRMEHETLRTWPQVTEQSYIDGFDLRQDRQTVTNGPDNVWLVVDSIDPSTTRFTTTLTHNGYKWVGTAALRGVHILHFRRMTR